MKINLTPAQCAVLRQLVLSARAHVSESVISNEIAVKEYFGKVVLYNDNTLIDELCQILAE